MARRIAVIGAGGWGTTLASLLGDNGHDVHLWARENEVVDEINSQGKNSMYLKGVKISRNVKASNSLKNVVDGAEVIVSAVPAQFTREVAKNYSGFIGKEAVVLNVSKGIELGTFKTMSQVLSEELKNVKIAALSGPNHAEEVSRKIPTATVIASENLEVLPKLKEILQTDYFKVYPHDDIVGIEICGSVKNITAIATGVCDGLGLGDNSKGSIITLGLREMSLFGKHYGAKRKTFYGLAGVGDLVATCTSKHSRNRFVGEKLGEGKNFEEIKDEMKGMVAEGVKTVKAVYEFSKEHKIDMPLTNQAYKVLYEAKNLKEAVKDLVRLI